MPNAASTTKKVDLGYLEQFLADVDEHGTAEPQQAVIAASFVTEQGIPQAYAVWEGELLREQQGYPPECVELWVHLHIPTFDMLEWRTWLKTVAEKQCLSFHPEAWQLDAIPRLKDSSPRQ